MALVAAAGMTLVRGGDGGSGTDDMAPMRSSVDIQRAPDSVALAPEAPPPIAGTAASAGTAATAGSGAKNMSTVQPATRTMACDPEPEVELLKLGSLAHSDEHVRPNRRAQQPGGQRSAGEV